jgi:hypothetical protein
VTAIFHLSQSHPVSTHSWKGLASDLAEPSAGLLGTEGAAAQLSLVDAEASTELLAEHPAQWQCHHIPSLWVFLNMYKYCYSELKWDVYESLLVRFIVTRLCSYQLTCKSCKFIIRQNSSVLYFKIVYLRHIIITRLFSLKTNNYRTPWKWAKLTASLQGKRDT